MLVGIIITVLLIIISPMIHLEWVIYNQKKIIREIHKAIWNKDSKKLEELLKSKQSRFLYDYEVFLYVEHLRRLKENELKKTN